MRSCGLSSGADYETIERVYRTLMKRFHPDNDKTGDAEIFLRIAEAHRILSDPSKRQRYDAERDNSKSVVRFDLRSREFFAGLRGEQNRRLAVLCLLYRKRVSDHESPGLSILELEQMSGFTREELGFALWYLNQKDLAMRDDHTMYGITAGGVDFVESQAAGRPAGTPGDRGAPDSQPRRSLASPWSGFKQVLATSAASTPQRSPDTRHIKAHVPVYGASTLYNRLVSLCFHCGSRTPTTPQVGKF